MSPDHTISERHKSRVRKIRKIVSQGRKDLSLNERIKQSSKKRA